MRIILVGPEMIVLYLSEKYRSKGYQISVIDKDKNVCDRIAPKIKGLVVNGDATLPESLKKAQAESAQIIASLTSKDEINLASCLTGKELFGIRKTMTIANYPDNYEFFKKMGIDHIFNKGELVFEEMARRDETDYLHFISSYSGESLQFLEITLKEGMPSVGYEIVAVGLPRQTVVISIIKNGTVIFPVRDYILEKGDRLILATTPEMLSKTVHLVCGD